MEQKELRSWEALCIQDEPARCRAGCPFNMDARAFVMAMAAGNVQSGRAILDKSIPLPQITGSICEAPCEQYCLRKELGGPIAIASLERTCLGSTLSRGKLLRLPPRPKKVVLIGGGPASLVVAYDLAKKGYPIELYHSALPGGWLHQLPIWQLPRERLNEELALLKKGGVNFHQVERLDIALLRELEQTHDAIFIECSEELQPELLAYVPKPDMTTMATSSAKIFSDGLSSSSGSYVLAASHGREAALSIDRFLQGASLTAARPPLRHGQTALYTNTASIGAAARVTPAAGPDYSMEEAHSEAGRCLDCQCLECVKNCVYLQKFGSYPRVYARQIYNNEAIVKGIHQANILINSCSLCNQCATLCPNDFSMAELCLQARQRMVTESRMPPSAHEFALSEMRAARGDREQLLGHAPGYSTSSALFFPGCQLSGVRPDQTFALYAYLRKTTPDTGIWLSCCGAPAHWAGRQQEFNEIMMDLTNQWQQLGRPKMIFACSSCLKIIRDNLPEIEAISVWNLIKAGDFARASASSPVALSDPCTSRQDTATQSTVRKLVQDLGQPLENLTASGELTECCGYGGLMANANTAVSAAVIESRSRQNDAPFLTYCIMCREQLAEGGKESIHLLDLLFPEWAREAKEPKVSISDRRDNRTLLANRMRSEFYQEQESSPDPWDTVEVTMDDSIRALLEQRRILVQDVRQVLYTMEKEGKWLEHGKDQIRMTSLKLGTVTVWLRFLKEDSCYTILSAWSHRMQIGRILP